MQRYLRIQLQDKKYYLGLDLIREKHIDFLKEIDQALNAPVDPSLACVHPSEMTDYLFEDHEYILSWIISYIDWKVFLDLLMISETQWHESEKKIVYCKSSE